MKTNNQEIENGGGTTLQSFMELLSKRRTSSGDVCRSLLHEQTTEELPEWTPDSLRAEVRSGYREKWVEMIIEQWISARGEK